MNPFDLTRPNSVTKYDYNSYKYNYNSHNSSVHIVYETDNEQSIGGVPGFEISRYSGQELEMSHSNLNLGLALLDNQRRSAYSDTLDIVDYTAEVSPIYVNKDYTLWFVLLYKIFRFKFEKSLKYHKIMTQNKIVHAILTCSIISYFIFFFVEGEAYVCHTTLLKITIRFIAGFAFIGGFLMANVDCILFALKTNFSIYWRCWDVVMIRICGLFILLKNGNCGSKYLESTNNLTLLILTVIWECVIIGGFFVTGVAMIQSYLNLHFIFQIGVVLICVACFIYGTIYRIMANETSTYGFWIFNNFYYSMDFNDYIVVKAIDVSIWFSWQLYVMFRYGNKIRVANAKRQWIVVSK